jgi:GH24 family phage-related lysozyme (muramidase)
MNLLTISIEKRGDKKVVNIEAPIFQRIFIFALIAILGYLSFTPPSTPVILSTYQVPVKSLSALMTDMIDPQSVASCAWCIPTVEPAVENPLYYSRYSGVSTQKLAWVDNSQFVKSFPRLSSAQTSLSSLARSIMKGEGRVRGVYYDKVGSCGPRGCLTIGYGFCFHKPTCGNNKEKIEAVIRRPITMSTKMNEAEMQAVLTMFLADFSRSADRNFGYMKSRLSKAQWETIIEMCYNGGCGGVKSKTKGMIAALARGNASAAAAEFKKTGWCRQIRSRCDYFARKLQEGIRAANDFYRYMVADRYFRRDEFILNFEGRAT